MADDSQYYPKHECGIFGIYGHPDASMITYYGLYALQHRGQESAGITCCNDGKDFHTVKGMGLVPQIFDEDKLKSLKGNRAIGHVRYSTTGSSHIINAQPIVVNCAQGRVAVGHNGNLINANSLREELEANGSIFQTTVDSEIILHLMAQPRNSDNESSLIYALKRIQGAYSLVIMSENEIIGVRDPHGFRPLCIGKLGDSYILSSETCALDLVQAEFIRDVEPGEIVIINDKGLRSLKPFVPPENSAFCIFEYVYFARPDSNINNVNVSMTRFRMGQELAKRHEVDADVVIPVPDSGNYAALGYSEYSGIPFEQAFVRNHYVGRTFIQPTQLIRDFGVRVKLNLIKASVKGKRVIVVDDSIVRGTTARARVVNLREAGAKEVHVRVSCPPHRFPCHYGIDFPNRKELLANKYTNAEIAEYLGADSVGYLDVDGMIRATTVNPHNFCLACFTGDYPIKYSAETDKFIMERQKSKPAPALVPQEEQTRLL